MAKYTEHRIALLAAGLGLMAFVAPVVFPHLHPSVAYPLFVGGGILALCGLVPLVVERFHNHGSSKELQRAPSELGRWMQRTQDERDEVHHRKAIREAELAVEAEAARRKEYDGILRQLNVFVERGELLLREGILDDTRQEWMRDGKKWKDEVCVFLASLVGGGADLAAFKQAGEVEGTTSMDYQPPHATELHHSAVVFTVLQHRLALIKIRDRYAGK